MKQLMYYLFLLSAFTLSCSQDDGKETGQEEDKTTRTDKPTSDSTEYIPMAFVGIDTDINVFFTDSNNISVLDKAGYNWKLEDIKAFRIVDGKEVLVNYNTEHSFSDHPNGIIILENFPLWVYIGLYTEGGAEYQTSLLKFPNNTVDTLYYQIGEYLSEKGVSNGIYIEKLWYNNTLKFDITNRELNPAVFPDGRKRGDRQFQIIK